MASTQYHHIHAGGGQTLKHLPSKYVQFSIHQHGNYALNFHDDAFVKYVTRPRRSFLNFFYHFARFPMLFSTQTFDFISYLYDFISFSLALAHISKVAADAVGGCKLKNITTFRIGLCAFRPAQSVITCVTPIRFQRSIA